MKHPPRVTSSVIFVSELERSVDFSCEVLSCGATIHDRGAALLLSPGGFQIYLIARTARTWHPSRAIGPQYLIWAVDSAQAYSSRIPAPRSSPDPLWVLASMDEVARSPGRTGCNALAGRRQRGPPTLAEASPHQGRTGREKVIPDRRSHLRPVSRQVEGADSAMPTSRTATAQTHEPHPYSRSHGRREAGTSGRSDRRNPPASRPTTPTRTP